jgi:hypothetical protein
MAGCICPQDSNNAGEPLVDERCSIHGDNAQPVPEHLDGVESVQDAVIADIEARKRVGLERYGTLLQPGNGRDALRDLYEELIDACMYVKQALLERSVDPMQRGPVTDNGPGRYESVPGRIYAVRWNGANLRQIQRWLELYDAEDRVRKVPERLELKAGVGGASGWVGVPTGHWIAINADDTADLWPLEHGRMLDKYREIL